MRFNVWQSFFRILWPSLPERPVGAVIFASMLFGLALLMGLVTAPEATAVVIIAVFVWWLFKYAAKAGRDAEAMTQRERLDGMVRDACAYIEQVNASRSFPAVWMKNVNAKPDEFGLIHETATLFEQKTRSYTLGGGTRLRVGKVPLYLGGAQRFSYQELAPMAAGDLYLTNQRVVFMSDKKAVSLPLAGLIGIDSAPDSITVHGPKRAQPYTFAVGNSALFTLLLKLFSQGHLNGQTLPDGVTITAKPSGEPGEVDFTMAKKGPSVQYVVGGKVNP